MLYNTYIMIYYAVIVYILFAIYDSLVVELFG
jgi:hypothetical protein